MEFRLNRKLPIEVQEALLAEKALKPPANTMSFLHYPVTMVDEETLRLDLHNCAAPQELLSCLSPNIEQHPEVLEEATKS